MRSDVGFRHAQSNSKVFAVLIDRRQRIVHTISNVPGVSCYAGMHCYISLCAVQNNTKGNALTRCNSTGQQEMVDAQAHPVPVMSFMKILKYLILIRDGT